MAVVKILGIKVATGAKTGRKGYTYYFSEPFSDYEVDTADRVTGIKVGQEFCYKDFPVVPGDEVTLSYEKGFQDKAVLSDMQIVKSAVKN